MVSRMERSLFADWWWTVDRLLLAALFALMMMGIVLSLAASPAVAERLGLSTFHFANRQVIYAIPALLIMLGVSLLSPRYVRWLALAVFTGSLILVIGTLFFGAEVKGARRWINIPLLGGLQPSEFLKPAFVVLSAWLFSEAATKRHVPGNMLAIGLLVLTIVPLVLQPDIGQTTLVVLVWMGLFFLAGLHWFWVAGLMGLGSMGMVLAYMFIPHVTGRINRFLDPGSGDTFQVDTALESIVSGGFFGKGPGEGIVKRILPDSHTDFIFAVTAEEFGIIACLALVTMFMFVVLRSLSHAFRHSDGFTRLAICGLTAQFGLQAMINMSVNLHLIPAKGMTLPFISYGGSSLFALALGMGMLLALTRRRPLAETLLVRPHPVHAYS
jgi:cell division protein FtsW